MGKRWWFSFDRNDIRMDNDPCYSILIATDHGDVFEILNNPETWTFEQSNWFNFSIPVLSIKVNSE